MTRRNFLRTLGIGAVSLPVVGLGAAEYRSADFAIGQLIRYKGDKDWPPDYRLFVITNSINDQGFYELTPMGGYPTTYAKPGFLENFFEIIGCVKEERTIAII